MWQLGLCLLLGVAPLRVNAQDAPSAQQVAAGNELLEAGNQAFSAGRYAEALESFEQAHQRLQKPAILKRIGQSADKLGDHEKAASAYEWYLGAEPKAPDRAQIESRIKANREAQQGALSPEAAARAGAGDLEAPEQATTQDPDRNQAWWLWAGAGVLAVASIVVIAVVVGSSSTHDQAPARSNVGGVVLTLEGR
jgi:tetratricopeptide (TPR) repeat protein